ncbi:MAG: trypsin-like peptidase domain-containing protein [Bacteroidales bacterium]|nr:trypsin-like peptidase domain-containing protein [Candidatus Scybalocola fimicaballi]
MKDMKKSVLTACSIAIFSSLLLSCKEQTKLSSDNITNAQINENSSVNQSNNSVRTAPTGVGVDFTVAAERSLNSVVHIITYSQGRRSNVVTLEDLFGQFFGSQPRRQQRNYGEPQPTGSGSGVILDSLGYIVTNNHVVDGAEKVKVTLNDKRVYAARIVGTDPSTDLALLKIEADNLSPIEIGNSDDLRVGEWVLAVGNPFNLTSTVTAGIVSAKGRNLNMSGSMKIESFIQTDAAVNPGNSGGALVNLNGELVGINSAIASQTGSFAGYAFAIPVSIMKKIVTDLKYYGAVQRALLGIVITDISDELAKANNINRLDGVLVVEVGETGGAKDAGMQNGDVIIAVDDVKVKSVAEIQDRLTRFSPNDEVKVTVDRQGEIMNFNVKLRGVKEYEIKGNE